MKDTTIWNAVELRWRTYRPAQFSCRLRHLFGVGDHPDEGVYVGRKSERSGCGSTKPTPCRPMR